MQVADRTVEYKYLVGAAFVVALFMDLMDSTVVNVALPRLGQDFQARPATLEWVVSGYLISLATWIPASGWLGDRFGTKRIFLLAMGIFVAGSLLCSRAWTIESLVAFRVLQGVGGGMMTPVGSAMLFRAFTGSERAQGAAFLTIATAVAPLLGPVVGGFLVDHASWRWIFYVNVPLGIAGLIFAALVLKEHRESNPGSLDAAGFVLSALGLSGILLALAQGPEAGWTSPKVLALGLGGLAAAALLVLVELGRRAPLLDLRLFADPMFRAANLTMFATFSTLAGVLFVMPFFLQSMRGLSAFQSGALGLPSAVAPLAMVGLGRRVYARYGARRLMSLSSAGLAVTSGLLLLIDLDTNLAWIGALALLRGLALSLAFISMQTAALAAVSPGKMGRATSLFSTQRQVAGSFGVAALATVFSLSLKANGGSPIPLLAAVQSGNGAVLAAGVVAFHVACGLAAIISAVGVLFALQLRPDVSQASMAPLAHQASASAEWHGRLRMPVWRFASVPERGGEDNGVRP